MKGAGVNATARKTRACTLETMDEGLKTAIRSHATSHGLGDIEADILMCCETITVRQRRGLFQGLRTSLSAVYVTPKWLVWAESHGRSDSAAGTARLKDIEVRDYRTTTQYAITPDQGLNITGRYTDTNRTGITFLVLDCEAEGQKFREVLAEALSRAAKHPPYPSTGSGHRSTTGAEPEADEG